MNTQELFVIRARGSEGTGGLVYWQQTPYEDENGIRYHFVTHPTNATVFQDRAMAESFASFQPKHCQAEAIRADIALETHGMAPAPFPFSVFHIPLDAELDPDYQTA